MINSNSITCRKRHKKCDERGPKCGDCTISDRDCVWPDAQQASGDCEPASAGLSVSFETVSSNSTLGRSSLGSLQEEDCLNVPLFNPALAGQHPGQTIVTSPSNTVGSDFLTADLASIRWLDLLAADAEQANRGFSRAPSPSVEVPFENNRPFASSNASNNGRIGSILSGSSEIPPSLGTFPWRLANDIILKDFESIILEISQIELPYG